MSIINKSDFPNYCFLWPWKGRDNQRISLLEAYKLRKFTFTYLIICYLILIFFGYASTRDCTSTWQLEMYCKYSYWAGNLYSDPLVFIRNLFTMTLIHNSTDHIGFVTFGMLLVVQAYEARCGFTKTVFNFFFGYLVMGLFYSLFFKWGLSMWPDSEFFIHSFARSWIGGSIGFYFVFGSLIFYCKKPLTCLMIPVSFEILNLVVLNISPQITFAHLTATAGGILYKLAFDKIRRRKTKLKLLASIAP